LKCHKLHLTRIRTSDCITHFIYLHAENIKHEKLVNRHNWHLQCCWYTIRYDYKKSDKILTTHPKYNKKYKKYNPGSPNIDDVIENVIVFLYFWKYKTRKQKYIFSGFAIRVLYFWNYKRTIKYNFHPDKMHP
jgi:hypothetical protein